MSTAPLDLELASVSRKLHAFNGAFIELRRMRRHLAIDPQAAIRLADSLEADAKTLAISAQLLRHEAVQQLNNTEPNKGAAQ